MLEVSPGCLGATLAKPESYRPYTNRIAGAVNAQRLDARSCRRMLVAESCRQRCEWVVVELSSSNIPTTLGRHNFRVRRIDQVHVSTRGRIHLLPRIPCLHGITISKISRW
jgi:hypothetical protein